MTKVPDETVPQLYGALMREIKLRLDAVKRTMPEIAKKPKDPGSFLACEFCYLQHRRCCELVALSILLAHNGIDEFRKKDMMKAWHAEKLIRMLEGLSDDAFPEPTIIHEANDDGVANIFIDDKASINRKRLAKIYNDCGEKLHAGSLRNLVEDGPRTYDLGSIQDNNIFFIRLLDHHAILLPDAKALMFVVMRHAPNDDVHCALHSIEAGDRELGELYQGPPIFPERDPL